MELKIVEVLDALPGCSEELVDLAALVLTASFVRHCDEPHTKGIVHKRLPHGNFGKLFFSLQLLTEWHSQESMDKGVAYGLLQIAFELLLTKLIVGKTTIEFVVFLGESLLIQSSRS